MLLISDAVEMVGETASQPLERENEIYKEILAIGYDSAEEIESYKDYPADVVVCYYFLLCDRFCEEECY